MRVLKMHNPTGHPYWQKNEYRVQKPNGEFINLSNLFDRNGNHGGYEIYIENGDVFFVQCGSGSGYGKVRGKNPIKIVARNEYDKIEYIGQQLEMSACLKNDLAENGLS